MLAAVPTASGVKVMARRYDVANVDVHRRNPPVKPVKLGGDGINAFCTKVQWENMGPDGKTHPFGCHLEKPWPTAKLMFIADIDGYCLAYWTEKELQQ